MVFRCQQNRHDLIPRACNPQRELDLAAETKEFRASLLPLFQREIDSFRSAAGAGPEDLQRRWPQVRRQLDGCAEIRGANARSGQAGSWCLSTVPSFSARPHR